MALSGACDAQDEGAAQLPPVEALTLRAAGKSRRDIPPSSSYLQILQDGAYHWKLDRSYQVSLSKVRTAKHLVIPSGISGILLKAASCANPQEKRR
jgi:hypothetical protein